MKLHVFTKETPSPEVLDKVLNPYSARRKVDLYVAGRRPKSDLPKLVENFVSYYGEDDADGRSDLWLAAHVLDAHHIEVDDSTDELVIYSDSNPNDKFDRYEREKFYGGTLPGKRTSAQLKHIVFDRVIQANELEAHGAYDQIEAATAGLEKGPTWEEMLAKHGDVGTRAFKEIMKDPWFAAAFEATGKSFSMEDDWDSKYGSGRDAFLRRYPARDVPSGYIDLDGKWHDRGDQESSVVSPWTTEYRKYRDSLPGDVWVTVVHARY